jgi:hypothetical protein
VSPFVLVGKAENALSNGIVRVPPLGVDEYELRHQKQSIQTRVHEDIGRKVWVVPIADDRRKLTLSDLKFSGVALSRSRLMSSECLDWRAKLVSIIALPGEGPRRFPVRLPWSLALAPTTKITEVHTCIIQYAPLGGKDAESKIEIVQRAVS